ncbi:hypothetical protein FHT86_002453 [Rhizobium sp. BK313]|nr:hypothetical protein [Rhizobium sp. BK313]
MGKTSLPPSLRFSATATLIVVGPELNLWDILPTHGQYPLILPTTCHNASSVNCEALATVSESARS